MRVVFVGTFGLHPKGTMRLRALPLGLALTKRGHEVTLALPPWDDPQEAGHVLSEGGVRIVNLPLGPRVPVLWYVPLTLRLARFVLSLRPQVVHLFKPKGFAGLVAMLLWLRRRFGEHYPIIVTDADDWEGAGGWNQLLDYPWPQKPFFQFQESWGLRHSDALTVASRELEAHALGLAVPSARLLYLPNGTRALPQARPSAREEVRRRYGFSEAPLLLLYTRFFEFEPGRVLEVIGRVFAALPAARLLVVGKGLRGEESRFAALASGRGLFERIFQAGWVAEEELTSYFAAADLAIYPYDDTRVNRAKCSVKLIDLLSFGLCVVAERVGQNAEYIEDGVSGRLVTCGDGAAFAHAIVESLQQHDQRRRMGQAAQRRMAELFAWDKLAGPVEKLYLQLAGSPAGPPATG